MKPELKQKWVEALRSGQYEQGQGRLCVKNGDKLQYCCLGVLCEILGYKKTGNCHFANVQGFIGPDDIIERAMPSFAMLKDFGFDETEAYRLAKMNDSQKSFLEIANYIEANL